VASGTVEDIYVESATHKCFIAQCSPDAVYAARARLWPHRRAMKWLGATGNHLEEIVKDLVVSGERLVKDVAKGAEALVDAGLSGAVGLFRDVVALWGLFAIVFVVGFAALVARATVLWVAPSISHHSRLWAHIFDVVLDVISMLEVTIGDVIAVIKTVIKDIEHLFHHGKGHATPHLTTYKLVHINATGLADFMDHLVDDCGPYNTVESIAYPTFKKVVSPAVCPAIRYLYPVPHLYTAADAALGWASYDSRPWPYGNCQPSADEDIDIECVALGSGYLVLEVLLPAILGIIVLLRLAPVIWRAIVLVGQLAAVATFAALRFVLELL